MKKLAIGSLLVSLFAVNLCYADDPHNGNSSSNSAEQSQVQVQSQEQSQAQSAANAQSVTETHPAKTVARVYQPPGITLLVPQGNDGLSASTPFGGANFTVGSRFNQLLQLASLKLQAGQDVSREIAEMEYETQTPAFLWVFKGWNPLGGICYWKPIHLTKKK